MLPGGPAVPGPDDPLDIGDPHLGHVHRRRSAHLERRSTPGGAWCRGSPIWRLFGEVRRWAAVPPLPPSLEAVPFESVAADRARRRATPPGDARTTSTGTVIGAAHPADHGFLRRDGRVGFLVRDRGTGAALGYVYGSGIGRMGPLLALDPALHPTLMGVAVRETPALGPVALWVPGTADVATRALLDAGLRLDGFPGLVCWSRPDHPFERYLPISLALV